MHALMKVLEGPEEEINQRSIDVSRLPVLGEYVLDGRQWFEVKRVVHLSGSEGEAGIVYAIPVVDPTREPLRLYEWLEPAP